MSHIIFTSQKAADDYSAAVDKRMGYPKAGTNVGGGIHAPTEQGMTLRYGDVRKHPKDELWAYPDPGLTDLPLPDGAVKSTLDESWTPPLPELLRASGDPEEAEAKPES
jgi:hypothetical protein